MGMILEFRSAEPAADKPEEALQGAKMPKGHSAEIIIFPGVRIERNKEADKKTASAKPRKRAKKTARRKS